MKPVFFRNHRLNIILANIKKISAKSHSTKLLLTKSEVYTVNYCLIFFLRDLWPYHKSTWVTNAEGKLKVL